MEERLEDRTRLVGPVAIHLCAEGLSGSRRDNLQEPRVEALALIVLAQCFHDPKGQILQVEDFEALMVKTVEGVFESPMAFGFLEQFFQRGQVGLQRLKQWVSLAIDVGRCLLCHGWNCAH